MGFWQMEERRRQFCCKIRHIWLWRIARNERQTIKSARQIGRRWSWEQCDHQPPQYLERWAVGALCAQPKTRPCSIERQSSKIKRFSLWYLETIYKRKSQKRWSRSCCWLNCCNNGREIAYGTTWSRKCCFGHWKWWTAPILYGRILNCQERPITFKRTRKIERRFGRQNWHNKPIIGGK